MRLFDPNQFSSINFDMFVINRLYGGNWRNVLVLQQIQKAQYLQDSFSHIYYENSWKAESPNLQLELQSHVSI